MKRLWLVRLGRHGEQEAHGLETGELVLGFRYGVLTGAKDRDAILRVIQAALPDANPKRQLHFAAQLNQFCNTMQIGDLAVVPLKTESKIAIGEIVSECAMTAGGHPMRRVRWLRPDVSRDAFRQDLLYSFGAFMTVCEITRNDALARVEAVARSGRDPGYEASAVARPAAVPTNDAPSAEEADKELDKLARDQIERRITSTFAGHEFSELIGAILTAQGYLVRITPPGSDQGIDIVAGRGALGFDAPRLVVQVKSGDVVADQPTLQALIGAVQDTHAHQGLLVSWGGFNRNVDRRRNELFFRIRLWGRDEVLDALFEVYDRLPEGIRAELPLRRTWMLVPDPDDAAG